MTKYNTNNPVGSPSPKDVNDNAIALDNLVNSTDITTKDRFGNDRLTIKGLEEAAISAGPTVEAAAKALEQANLAREAAESVQVDLDSSVNNAKLAATESQKSAADSKESADRAVIAAGSVAIDSRTFDTKEEGISVTSNGEYFKVWAPPSSGLSFIYYKNDKGAARELTNYPSAEAVKGVNILYDAMNEISGHNEGRAYGHNLFINTGNATFKSDNHLGLITPVAYSDENSIGFISKQYPASQLPLIKGSTLFCSAMTYTESPVTDFSVFFRKGVDVIASKTFRSRGAGKVILPLFLDIPSEDFDIVEFRVAKDIQSGNGLIELGGFSASYGIYAEFNSAQIPAERYLSGNLLWDSHNEYSYAMSKDVIDWFLGAKPTFVDDVNMGANTIETTERLYKHYNVAHLSLIPEVPIYAGATVYSSVSGVTLYVQYMKEGKYLTTPRQTLNAGMNQVVIKTVLNQSPDVVRFLIEPVSGSKARINDFFLSYDAVNSHQSGAIPPKYRYLDYTTSQNLLWDSFGEVSANYPELCREWFSKGSLVPTFREGTFLTGRFVTCASGVGRLAKSYNLSHINLNKQDALAVSCTLHVESGSCKFYAQFMKNKEYLHVPQEEFGVGTHQVNFVVKLGDIPTHLNFLFDTTAGTQLEVTNFGLAFGLNVERMSAPLPLAYLPASENPDNGERDSENTYPLRNYHFKSEQLKLNKILSGDTAGGSSGYINPTLLNIGFIGDSWTHAYNRYSGSLAIQIANHLGDAGGGWISFSAYNRLGASPWLGGNGNIRPHLYSVAYDDNNKWNKGIYSNCPTPDICTAGSDTVGARITVKGVRPINKADLLYIPSAGSFDYRFNDGAWVTIDANGAEAIKTLSLLNLPTGNTWTFELVVKSGLVKVSGMNVVQSNSGVLCHKLGATGSRALDWAAQDNEAMITSFKALSLDTAFIMLATNDQGSSVTPASFRGYIQTIVQRLRSANPAIDICIVAPCENQRTDVPFPMKSYTEQAKALANAYDCGFIDLQLSFGDDPSYYAANGANPLFNADKIHPEPATGGRLISSTIMRALNTK
ncbi:TPA: SGNH/GDSL hydrolase family protein [Providencia rettgeri]|nr:SGNH/GDSL hydrolase family protein [Providencia rettgeri]